MLFRKCLKQGHQYQKVLTEIYADKGSLMSQLASPAKSYDKNRRL